MKSIFKNNGFKSLIIPLSIFSFTFILYLHNLAKFIYGGDVGDFLLAVGVRGVAHPSGYPLFTLLGILFSYLPINASLAYKVGLVSAISSSFSVVLLYLISLNLTKNKIISVISSLVLAFSYVFWLYAEVAEVFALAGLFFLLLSYLALLYYEKKQNVYLYLLAFLTGLSLSHHIGILSLFPSLVILILSKNIKIVFDYKVLLKCLLLFIVGFLPYLYIPIAASQYPPYSWDNAVNLQNFIQLVTRGDYTWGTPITKKEFIKSALDMRLWTFYTYLVDLSSEITVFVLGLSFLGILDLIYRKKYAIFISLLLVYVLIGPFFIIYSSVPNLLTYTTGVIERFYIFSLIFIAIFFSLGSASLLRIINAVLKRGSISEVRLRNYRILLYVVLLIIPFYLFKVNFNRTDLSNTMQGENLAQDYLRSLPKNSYLLISGDTASLNVLYLQQVLEFRKDVRVINAQIPDLDIGFVKKIFPDYKSLSKSYRELKSKIQNQILKDYGKKFTFSSYGSTIVDEKNVSWIPYGLNRKMVVGSFNESEEEFIKKTAKIWSEMKYKKISELSESEKDSQILSTLQLIYSQAAYNTGYFIQKKYNNLEEARKYFEISYIISPLDNLGRLGLANYYFSKDECSKSEGFIKEMLIDEPGDKTPYVYLYKIYKECYKDSRRSENIKKVYEEVFKKKFPKDKK